MDDVNCTLCGQVAHTDLPWEVMWSLHCASSVHRLLDLDHFDLSFFEAATYCPPCKELIRDIHFMTNSVAVLGHRLDMAKAKVAQMLLDDDVIEEEVEWPEEAVSGHTTLDHEPMTHELCDVVMPDSPQAFDYPSDYLDPSDELYAHPFTVPEDDDPEADESEAEFGCRYPGCGALFLSVSELDEHNPTHLDWRAYGCALEGCGSSFKQKKHLERHMKMFHGAQSEPHAFTIAQSNDGEDPDDWTAKLVRLKQRQKYLNYSEEEFEPFPQNSRKKFTGPKSRRPDPSEIHRYLNCSVEGCDKSFGRKSHLTRHMKQVHSGEKKRPRTFDEKFKEKFGSPASSLVAESLYNCSEEGCGKVFGTSAHLRRHLKGVHFTIPKRKSRAKGPSGKPIMVSQNFKCSVEGCGKTFGRKSHLVRHLRLVVHSSADAFLPID